MPSFSFPRLKKNQPQKRCGKRVDTVIVAAIKKINALQADCA